ncbi:MAG TPA: hypothetical protein VFW96_20310, partial [Thermomicrobiales bacterium]|nr:hypothetical protein [Thermomicrobiales bacterium]
RPQSAPRGPTGVGVMPPVAAGRPAATGGITPTPVGPRGADCGLAVVAGGAVATAGPGEPGGPRRAGTAQPVATCPPGHE